MRKVFVFLIAFLLILLFYPLNIIQKLSKRKKKVQNILLLVPSLNGGGAERVCATLANSLKDEYKITIVVGETKEKDYKVDANIVEIPELKNKFSKLIAIFKLKRLKKRLQIDICISYMTTFNFLNIASFQGEKAIISNHNYLSKKKEGFIPEVLHRIASFYADSIVNCSEAVQYDQIKMYPSLRKKMYVIPNFVDVDFIEKQSQESIPENMQAIFSDKVIFSFGRMTRVKNHSITILAFQKIYKKLSNVKLVFLGTGEEKRNLEKLVCLLNLEKQVFFLDYDSNPYKYLKRSTLFVLSSTYEGLPNVLLEAMALHIPIVATDCYGGNKEILSNSYKLEQRIEREVYSDYGVLVPMGDIDSLARVMLQLMKDNSNLLEKYRRKSRIPEKYSKDNVLKKWREIIQL